MDRINELIAKGLDNLSDEELAELQTLLHAEADELLDGETTDEQVKALGEIADNLDAAKAESTKREDAKAERAAKAKELADRIRGEAAPEGDAEQESGEVIEAQVDGEQVEVEAAAAATTEPEAAPVTAGATKPTARPIVTRVAARRPAAAAAKPVAGPEQAVIVASANVPGITAGTVLDTEQKVADALMAAAEASASYRGQGSLKMPVLSLRSAIPEERMLDRDALRNEAKIRAVTSPQALVASGGVCAEIPLRYDLPVVGSDVRPVRDALARFGAQRAGVRTLIPPSLVSASATLEDGIGKWTVANDENPTNPTTKPYMTIPCDDEDAETTIYAITQQVKLGNFRQRWFPEQVAAWMNLLGTYQARTAESWMLETIANGSINVTHGAVLSTATDVFAALRQLIATQRYRNRVPRGYSLRVIAPDWLRDNIIIDLIRKDRMGTVEEKLVRAETTVDAFFRALNCNVTWHVDFENGQTISDPGGPLAGAQGAGPVIGWPDKVRLYVFLEGSWLFLDGGALDLGVIRDSTLVGTNDLMMFSETFENAHYHGVPDESFVYDIDICASGASPSAVDLDPCTSGS